jgi:hypothetical protein
VLLYLWLTFFLFLFLLLFLLCRSPTEHERQRIAGETGRRSSSGSGVTSPELGRDDSYGGMMEDDFERPRKNRKVSFTGADNDGLSGEYGFGNDDFGDGFENSTYGDDYGNESMGTPMGVENEEGGLQADALFVVPSAMKQKNNLDQFIEPKMSNIHNMMRQLKRMSTSCSSSSSTSSSMSSVVDDDDAAPTLAFSKVVAGAHTRYVQLSKLLL